MADRFNEVFPDVILNCNYSALLSAWVYMHVCAAPNIPAELVRGRLCPLVQELLAHDRNLEPGLLPSRGYIVRLKNFTRVENPLSGNVVALQNKLASNKEVVTFEKVRVGLLISP